MKRAKKPLDKKAVKAANDDFYGKHPELVENGKRKPINLNNPAHAKFREEWMQAYEKNGGAIVGKNINNKPAGSALQPCPLKCKITKITAACKHGRQPDAKGILEVVPAELGDVISFSATYENECGTHPQWEVVDNSGVYKKTFSGASCEFNTMGWTYGLPQWLADVAPQAYKVTADSCSGKRMFMVKAYPSDKLNAKVDGKMWRSAKDKMDYVIESILAKYLKQPKFQLLEGSLGITAGWEEYINDHRAFYKYEVNIGFNPLFGGKLRVPFGPTAVIPEWMKTYGDAYCFVEIAGGVSVNGHWGRKTPDDKTSWLDAKGEISGKIGASLFLMNPKTVSVEIAGGTSIFVTAEGDDTANKPTALLQFSWGGLTGEATIAVAWGIVEFKREFIVVEPGKIHDQPFKCEIPTEFK
jgi:hypothetical protein